jgi:hypothetical protein
MTRLRRFCSGRRSDRALFCGPVKVEVQRCDVCLGKSIGHPARDEWIHLFPSEETCLFGLKVGLPRHPPQDDNDDPNRLLTGDRTRRGLTGGWNVWTSVQ